MNRFEDNYFIERVLSGDVSAYSSLVDRHKDMAYSIAYKVLRIQEDAEEVAQDAFLKAYQNLDKFKHEAKFSTWLFRIVYNTAISRTRKKRPDFSPIDERTMGNLTDDDIHENLDQMSSEEQQNMVTAAIDRLPEDESAIVTLFYMEDNSIEDISEITGLSRSNVKVKLFRIRKKLSAELHRNMLNEAIA